MVGKDPNDRVFRTLAVQGHVLGAELGLLRRFRGKNYTNPVKKLLPLAMVTIIIMCSVITINGYQS
jgi:hypothetical protein